MDGLQVLETIRKINPWFKTNEVPSAQLEDFKRREYVGLLEDIEKTEMATMVIGGRRVGKSVMMYQLIDHLLKKGVPSKRVLFVQGDNPILTELVKSGNMLNTIFKIYQDNILEQTFNEAEQLIYIFIDEAQNIPNWELEVKALIDLKYKLKFFITGSSSRELRQGAQNPLTGRVIIRTITPFSFADFSRYNINSVQQEKYKSDLSQHSEKFRKALSEGNINDALVASQNVQGLISQFNLKKRFDDYLAIGGFPWVISHRNKDDLQKYLRDLLTTTISKDIMTQVEIRDTQAFERLMVNLSLASGHPIKYKNLADILGLDERSVTRYVDYYVDSHWAFVSSQYVFHRRADNIKSEKKIYVIDSGVMNTLSFKDENDINSDRQYRGQVVENVIHNHLLGFKQAAIGAFQNYIPFWINDSGKEIDFILEIKGAVVPIEVKCKPSIDDEDRQPIQQFMKEHTSAKFGIITTEAILEQQGSILLIPYSVLALLL